MTKEANLTSVPDGLRVCLARKTPSLEGMLWYSGVPCVCRASYRAVGLYWMGSFLIHAIVLNTGNVVGKHRNNNGLFKVDYFKIHDTYVCHVTIRHLVSGKSFDETIIGFRQSR